MGGATEEAGDQGGSSGYPGLPDTGRRKLLCNLSAGLLNFSTLEADNEISSTSLSAAPFCAVLGRLHDSCTAFCTVGFGGKFSSCVR